MLQNDAVRNLQYDSEIRVAQQNNAEPRVYGGPISITSQPTSPERIPLPLPVSTVGTNISTQRSFSIPMTGYDFLTELPSLHIEQTFELNAALTSVSSENRYVVRSPLGDAVYAASESSTSNNRLLWGAARPFQMHLLDKTHQEAMLFRKQFALGSLCCHPKNLEVWIPPGNLLGRIVHSPTVLKPVYYIQDGVTGEPIFCIEGPENSGFCCFCLPKESFFRIHSGGDLRASIDHKWVANKSQYTTNIYFSDAKLLAKERALILGAAFLLEYMYFQTRM
ncbi:PREDICTED: phospholipid scramblase 2 isoform X1 [Rhagoletis zephyria]|uniref:phospholipid scramblase 2 isoform X1 n=1 Tax=Rhagoletis zephyria TaxID=28612 RepID=UPI0008113C89|nr:PREDICTED: phospholipid scramblase 2 isoform X1 [Rhagoletis zephyria]